MSTNAWPVWGKDRQFCSGLCPSTLTPPVRQYGSSGSVGTRGLLAGLPLHSSVVQGPSVQRSESCSLAVKWGDDTPPRGYSPMTLPMGLGRMGSAWEGHSMGVGPRLPLTPPPAPTFLSAAPVKPVGCHHV